MTVNWKLATEILFIPVTLVYVTFLIIFEEKKTMIYIHSAFIAVSLFLFGFHLIKNRRYKAALNFLQKARSVLASKQTVIIPRPLSEVWIIFRAALKVVFILGSAIALFTSLYIDLSISETNDIHSLLLFLNATAYVLMVIYVNTGRDHAVLAIWTPSVLVVFFVYLYSVTVEKKGHTVWIALCLELVCCIAYVLKFVANKAWMYFTQGNITIELNLLSSEGESFRF